MSRCNCKDKHRKRSRKKKPKKHVRFTLPERVHRPTMWEKLVVYYMGRLRALCNWRPLKPVRSHHNSAECFKKLNAMDDLKTRAEKRPCTPPAPRPSKYWARTKKLKDRAVHGGRGCGCKCGPRPRPRPVPQPCTQKTHASKESQLGLYMAAGYEVGTQQSLRIVKRALRYGMLKGILQKEGDNYMIKSQYLKQPRKAQKHCNCKMGHSQRCKPTSTGSQTKDNTLESSHQSPRISEDNSKYSLKRKRSSYCSMNSRKKFASSS